MPLSGETTFNIDDQKIVVEVVSVGLVYSISKPGEFPVAGVIFKNESVPPPFNTWLKWYSMIEKPLLEVGVIKR